MRQMRRLSLLATMLLLLWGMLDAEGAAAASPGLTVEGPVEGSNSMASSVTVKFSVTDFHIVPTSVPLSEAGKHPELNRPGEGHLHFMLDLQPLVVWDRTTPYTFSNLPPGDHQLMVELANNDHASLSPRVVKQIHFRTELPLPATGETTNSGGLLWYLVALAAILLCAGAFTRRLLLIMVQRNRDRE